MVVKYDGDECTMCQNLGERCRFQRNIWQAQMSIAEGLMGLHHLLGPG